MPKLIEEAVIEKCGECVNCGYSIQHNFRHCRALKDQIVDPDTIDPSCPLADCFVIHQVTGQDTIIEMLKKWGLLDAKAKNYEVIIVKKREG